MSNPIINDSGRDDAATGIAARVQESFDKQGLMRLFTVGQQTLIAISNGTSSLPSRSSSAPEQVKQAARLALEVAWSPRPEALKSTR